TPPKNWSWSVRENVTESGLYAPAWALPVMPALNAGANCGAAQPVTSKLLDGTVSNGSSAVLLHGISFEVVVAGPHVVGLASDAPAPPSVWMVSFSNGCWGLFSKTVVSCPVFWFTSVLPTSLTRTLDSCGSVPGSRSSACRNSRSILPSAASLGPHGEHWGSPRNSWPLSSSSISGVLLSTFPTSHARGHEAG